MKTILTAFATVLFGLLLPAQAQEAAHVFDKAGHAIFTVTVTTEDSSVVDVVAQGSAVLIAPGRLVTNCHVIDKGSLIFVSRKEAGITERVRLVGRDAQHDLCELDLVRAREGFDRPVQVAPAGTLRVGDPVYAIGSPRGMELTISNGIASAVRETGAGIRVIQTNASLSPGSSGGGLFDAKGRLVGITTFVAKDAQNLNFAVAAEYLASAGISPEELSKQRSVAAGTEAFPLREAAYERSERLRRQERSSIEERKRQLEVPPSNPGARAASSAPVTRRDAKAMAALLAVQENPSDARPVRTYEQLAKTGQLEGLDDDAVVRKVYAAVMADQVRGQLRWNGGGSPAAQFQVELRRNGEILYILPLKSSGQEAFDREAQRAIGVASPFPVPRDNDAFALVRGMAVEVKPAKK